MTAQLDLFAPPPADPLAHHIKTMRLCWPEWDGPKIGAKCQVESVIAYNVTHGEARYHYMAPCEIVGEENGEWIARIEYPEGSPCAQLYNGEILRLPTTNVWPPVYALGAARKAFEE